MIERKKRLTIVDGRTCAQKMIQELIKTAQKAGWGVRWVKDMSKVDISENRFDKIFSDYILWRGFEHINLYEAERVVAYLNKTNRCMINTKMVGGLDHAGDKLFQHGVWAANEEMREHILPAYMVDRRDEVMALVIAGKIKYPFCLKSRFGACGKGIYLVNTEADLQKIKRFNNMIVEPYVSSTYDWRVFVLGGRALDGVMRKVGNTEDEGDFIAKSAGRIHQKEQDSAILGEVKKLAVLAVKELNMDYAGVDLIRDDKSGKFYVLETNFAGGWQNGFLQATGVSVPEEIVKYFEKKYQEREKGLTK